MSSTVANFKREQEFLLTRCSVKDPHLTLTEEPRGFSRVSAEFPSYDGTQGVSCVAPGCSVSIRVARGTAALLSNHGRGIGPKDVLKLESRALSRVAAGNPGLPQLVTVTSESFSGCLWEVRNTLSCEGPLGIPLGLVQWKRASSRVEAGTSGFLSISDSDPRVSAELEQESQASSCVEEWNSACLLSCSRGDRPLVEL